MKGYKTFLQQIVVHRIYYVKGTEPGSQNTRFRGKEIWILALLIYSVDGESDDRTVTPIENYRNIRYTDSESLY